MIKYNENKFKKVLISYKFYMLIGLLIIILAGYSKVSYEQKLLQASEKKSQELKTQQSIDSLKRQLEEQKKTIESAKQDSVISPAATTFKTTPNTSGSKIIPSQNQQQIDKTNSDLEKYNRCSSLRGTQFKNYSNTNSKAQNDYKLEQDELVDKRSKDDLSNYAYWDDLIKKSYETEAKAQNGAVDMFNKTMSDAGCIGDQNWQFVPLVYFDASYPAY